MHPLLAPFVGERMDTELELMCRMVEPTGRVYPVEADPVTFRCLELRCKRNGLENALPIPTAVMHEIGEVMIGSEGHRLGHCVVTDGSGIGYSAADFIRAFLLDHGFALAERREHDDRGWAARSSLEATRS